MLLDTDYIVPALLTGYVRSSLADANINKFTLSAYLPNQNVDDLDYRVATGGTGLSDATTFRTFDAESPVGRRQGLTKLTGELPPISVKLRLGEYDRLRQRKVSEQAIVDALFDDAAVATDQVAARMELARGAALATGTVTISENGITGIVVDYGRAPGHTTAAQALWSTTSDPLEDLMTWRDTYVAANGIDPGSLLMSRRGLNTMLRNAAVRNQVFPGANQPSIVTVVGLQQLLEAYGLPPLSVYQAQVNVNGVPTKILPDTLALFLPAPGAPNDPRSTQLGTTLWGTTAESLEAGYGLEGGDEPGIVAGIYSDQDPVALWTKAAAIGLPVMANPNLSFAATIIA